MGQSKDGSVNSNNARFAESGLVAFEDIVYPRRRRERVLASRLVRFCECVEVRRDVE